MIYNAEYDVDIPEKHDLKYWYIQNYEDYEYANCIAYEMLIRTKEFNKIKNVKLKNQITNGQKVLKNLD